MHSKVRNFPRLIQNFHLEVSLYILVEQNLSIILVPNKLKKARFVIQNQNKSRNQKFLEVEVHRKFIPATNFVRRSSSLMMSESCTSVAVIGCDVEAPFAFASPLLGSLRDTWWAMAFGNIYVSSYKFHNLRLQLSDAPWAL